MKKLQMQIRIPPLDEDDLLYVLLSLRMSVEMTESKQNEIRYRRAYRKIHEGLLPGLAQKWFDEYGLDRELL